MRLTDSTWDWKTLISAPTKLINGMAQRKDTITAAATMGSKLLCLIMLWCVAIAPLDSYQYGTLEIVRF